jgi:hypothetical protein
MEVGVNGGENLKGRGFMGNVVVVLRVFLE